MSLSTFLNGRAPVQLRGLQWLALSDNGQVGAGTVTGDTGGGGTTSWSYGGTIPCRIDPLTDNETVAAGRISDRSTHLVTVPAGTSVSTGSRFVIASRGTYEVTGVQDQTGELARFFEVVQVVGADTTGVPFSPTDLGASLAAWWKADTLALSNGAAVTSWADSSGNARTLTQATGTNQPVYNTAQQNGLPAVTFDGTNDYLATAAFASPTSGASVFVVENLTAANQYRTILCHAAAATWISPFARVLARASDNAAGSAWQWIVQDAGVGANAVNDPVAAATATWRIIEFHYDQTNQWIVKAGTTAVTAARTGTLTSSTQPVFVGADTSLADNFAGKLGEIVYCSQLNGTQIGQVRSYLQGRWAL